MQRSRSLHGDATNVDPDSRLARGRILLLALPPVLLLSTYLAFNGLVSFLGFARGYLAAFLFYWIVWCFAVPAMLVGREGLRKMFRGVGSRLEAPGVWGWILLVLPLLVGFGYAFPRVLPMATVQIVLLSAALAVVNGTLEEVLWRGTYVQLFPESRLLGYFYPTVGFGLWHLAPQSVTAGPDTPGGSAAFVMGAILFGLCWGWVAHRTGSIRWTALSHVLLNLAGLGALIYFA